MARGERLPDLAVREVVPRDKHPNLRDHGMTVDRALLELVWRLAKKHGEAFVAESSLRRMYCEDTGHMPGVDTVPSALERFERQGLIAQDWLLRGGILPDGQPCKHGMRLIVPAKNRHERLAFIKRATYRNRRAGVTRKVSRPALEAVDARGGIAAAVAPLPDVRAQHEAAKRAKLDKVAELVAAGFFDAPAPKAPS